MDARPTELPRAYFAMLGQLLAEHDVARQTQAQAIFAGTAGDEVYFGGGEALAAVDYFHDHGVRGKLFEVARSAADLEYRSIWSVLRQAVRQGIGDQCWEIHGDVRRTSPLVNWNVVEQFTEQEPGRYPWYDKARYFPPGKQQQIGRLSFAADRGGDSSYPVPGDPEHVTPLFSQPLIETCLRIPSYVLTGDGINRPLARKAFADALPREVLERRTKGGQELYTADIVNRNLPFFRELMLDGQLVRHGFLDRKKLESAMSGGPSGVMRGMSKLSKHICLEVWLALWRKQNQTRLAETPRHAVEAAQA
jgi:asparagine synthase (glutamine-hydrolysing)